MKKQKIELELDMPPEWEFDKFDSAKDGDPCLNLHGSVYIHRTGASCEYAGRRIILRKKEPAHVKLARDLIRFWGCPKDGDPVRWVDLSKLILAEYESSLK